jgi:hypothetical protein
MVRVSISLKHAGTFSSVLEFVQQDSDLSSFATALDNAGLAEALSGGELQVCVSHAFIIIQPCSHAPISDLNCLNKVWQTYAVTHPQTSKLIFN